MTLGTVHDGLAYSGAEPADAPELSLPFLTVNLALLGAWVFDLVFLLHVVANFVISLK